MSQHTIENWLHPMTPEEIEERRKQWGHPEASTNSKDTEHHQKDPFEGYPVSLDHYLDDEFKCSIRGYDQEKMSFYEVCRECTSRYQDPPPQDLLIYLHCYRYKGNDWEYKASWPNWAEENWDLD